MKKQLLSLVLALAMIMSLFAGMGITAGASDTGAIPVDETIGLTDDTRDRYYIENYDYDDFFENPDAHWRYAYMSAAEGDAYLETLKSATLGTAVAPSNSVKITDNYIPYELYTGNHDRLVLLKVLNPYDASNPTYVVQSYAYFKLSDRVDSIKVAVNEAAIPEMVPGQPLVQGNDYAAYYNNFISKVISFVDGENRHLWLERSYVMDLVAKAPGGEWAIVDPTNPIQAGCTYGVLVYARASVASVNNIGTASYRAYFADRGAGVTVTCTNGDYNIVTADAELGDVTDTAAEYAFIVELLTTPGQGGNTPPAGGGDEQPTRTTVASLDDSLRIEGNKAYFNLGEGTYVVVKGSVEGAPADFIESLLSVNNIVGEEIVDITDSSLNRSDILNFASKNLVFISNSYEYVSGSFEIEMEGDYLIQLVEIDPDMMIENFDGEGNHASSVIGVYAVFYDAGGEGGNEPTYSGNIQNLNNNEDWSITLNGNSVTIDAPEDAHYFIDMVPKELYGDELEGIMSSVLAYTNETIAESVGEMQNYKNAACFSGAPKTGDTTITIDETSLIIVFQVNPNMMISNYNEYGDCYALVGAGCEEVVVEPSSTQVTQVNVMFDMDELPVFAAGDKLLDKMKDQFRTQVCINSETSVNDDFLAIIFPAVKVTEDNITSVYVPALAKLGLDENSEYDEILAAIDAYVESMIQADGVPQASVNLDFSWASYYTGDLINGDYALKADDTLGLVVMLLPPNGNYTFAEDCTFAINNGTGKTSAYENMMGDISTKFFYHELDAMGGEEKPYVITLNVDDLVNAEAGVCFFPKGTFTGQPKGTLLNPSESVELDDNTDSAVVLVYAESGYVFEQFPVVTVNGTPIEGAFEDGEYIFNISGFSGDTVIKVTGTAVAAGGGEVDMLDEFFDLTYVGDAYTVENLDDYDSTEVDRWVYQILGSESASDVYWGIPEGTYNASDWDSLAADGTFTHENAGPYDVLLLCGLNETGVVVCSWQALTNAEAGAGDETGNIKNLGEEIFSIDEEGNVTFNIPTDDGYIYYTLVLPAAALEGSGITAEQYVEYYMEGTKHPVMDVTDSSVFDLSNMEAVAALTHSGTGQVYVTNAAVDGTNYPWTISSDSIIAVMKLSADNMVSGAYGNSYFPGLGVADVYAYGIHGVYAEFVEFGGSGGEGGEVDDGLVAELGEDWITRSGNTVTINVPNGEKYMLGIVNHADNEDSEYYRDYFNDFIGQQILTSKNFEDEYDNYSYVAIYDGEMEGEYGYVGINELLTSDGTPIVVDIAEDQSIFLFHVASNPFLNSYGYKSYAILGVHAAEYLNDSNTPSEPGEEPYEISLDVDELINAEAGVLFFPEGTYTGQYDYDIWGTPESTTSIELNDNTDSAVVIVYAKSGYAFEAPPVVTVNGGAPIEGTFEYGEYIFEISGFTEDSTITVIGEAVRPTLKAINIDLDQEPTFDAIVDGEVLPNLDVLLDMGVLSAEFVVGGNSNGAHYMRAQWMYAPIGSDSLQEADYDHVANTSENVYYIEITVANFSSTFLIGEDLAPGNGINIINEDDVSYNVHSFNFLCFEAAESANAFVAVIKPASEDVHEHSYAYTANNNGTHNGTCECGEDAIVNEACTYVGGKCDKCGYSKPIIPPVHVHSYTYTSNNNGTHNGTCECDEDAITNEACAYGDDEVCDVCGYDSHEHKYTYTSNHNGTHNGACVCGKDAITNEACTYGNDEVCDLCGYDSHEHKYTYTSNNNGTHNGACVCGENAIVNEACAYVNGMCDKCGYAEPVTPPAPPAVNVPISNNENKVDVEAEISGNDATVKPLDEEQINKLVGSENASGDVVIDLSKLDESIDTAGIPKATLETIVKAAEDAGNKTEYLVIKLSTAELKLDDTAMRAIVDQANGDVIKFNFDDVGLDRMNETQKDAVKDMDVRKGYEAYITVNNERIGDFKGGEVEIIVPYEVPEGEEVAAFSVWYVSDDGTLEKQESTYDGKNKWFVVSHFSDYVIVYSAEEAPQTAGGSMWILWIILIILVCVTMYFIYRKRQSRKNRA